MENSNKTDDMTVVSYAERLFAECQTMLGYALREGKEIQNNQISLLDQKNAALAGSTDQLLSVYNYLIDTVKPANPRLISSLEKGESAALLLRLLGPLPIIRQFTLLAVCSLLGLVVTSLSPEINTHTIQLSMLQGYGGSQVYRLVFLIACASVGASFYGLFKINTYLGKGSFNLSTAHTYWSRYVLGIVAGLLLSELFVSFIEPASGPADGSNPLDSVGYLLKPILAILGGFSAGLVYRILSRLVDTVEGLFKGEADDILAQKESQYRLESAERAGKIRNTTAQQLLSLKQQMVQGNVSKAVLDQLDKTLTGVIGSATAAVPVTDQKSAETAK